MSERMRMLRIATVVGLMLCVGGATRAQQSDAGTQTSVPSGQQEKRVKTQAMVPGTDADYVGIDPSQRTVDEVQSLRNSERKKKLVEDTAKLLALATELKTEVDKANKNTLSLDVVRKAEEIEKLARGVKDEMKGS